MRRTILGLVIAVGFGIAAWSAAALAADVSGTWTGTFHTREGGAFETTLTLKADGDKLSGTFVQGPSKELAIENGKVSGDQISFSITRGRAEKPLKVNYEGKVEGDTLKLTGQAEGSPRKLNEMTLTRK